MVPIWLLKMFSFVYFNICTWSSSAQQTLTFSYIPWIFAWITSIMQTVERWNMKSVCFIQFLTVSMWSLTKNQLASFFLAAARLVLLTLITSFLHISSQSETKLKMCFTSLSLLFLLLHNDHIFFSHTFKILSFPFLPLLYLHLQQPTHTFSNYFYFFCSFLSVKLTTSL